MIITTENKIINFDNVREVLKSDTHNRIKGNFIKFFFDKEDIVAWEFESEKDLLQAWRMIIEGIENKWTTCDL